MRAGDRIAFLLVHFAAGSGRWKLRRLACRCTAPAFVSPLPMLRLKSSRHSTRALAAQTRSAVDRKRRFARSMRLHPRLTRLFYTDYAPSQVCQEHICDLRLKLSATAKSGEFAHVDFAAVPDEDLMCVPRAAAPRLISCVASLQLRVQRRPRGDVRRCCEQGSALCQVRVAAARVTSTDWSVKGAS